MHRQRPSTLAERRKHRRYPVWLEASLEPAGEEVLPVTLIDVSGGGALVHTPAADVDPRSPVALRVEDSAPSLPAVVLWTEREWDGTLYHLAFTFMDDPERAALRELLERCRPPFEARQRELVSTRPRSPRRNGAGAAGEPRK